jgi:hypothetical protein
MPDISLPEIHLPDVKLPEGLRDMNRQDIQSAIGDRVPKKIEMPDIDLSKIKMPDIDTSKLDPSKIDLSKIDLPKAVESRLPRRRTNPLLPLAVVAAIGAMFAAAWWLITSPTASFRVRTAVDRARLKLTGQPTDMVRYDEDANLGSLLPDPNQNRPSVEGETWPDTFSDLGDTVATGNGSTKKKSSIERPSGV